MTQLNIWIRGGNCLPLPNKFLCSLTKQATFFSHLVEAMFGKQDLFSLHSYTLNLIYLLFMCCLLRSIRWTRGRKTRLFVYLIFKPHLHYTGVDLVLFTHATGTLACKQHTCRRLHGTCKSSTIAGRWQNIAAQQRQQSCRNLTRFYINSMRVPF